MLNVLLTIVGYLILFIMILILISLFHIYWIISQVDDKAREYVKYINNMIDEYNKKSDEAHKNS